MGLLKKNGATEGSDSNGLSMTTEKTWPSSYLYSMGYLRKAPARQVVAQVNQVGRQNAWPSSYIYSMGLPEKSDGAAGSGSGEPRLTTEKRPGLLLIFILWDYLRKAAARQVVAQMS
jgi:hypothetical protein